MGNQGTADTRARRLTAAILSRQSNGPVHTWPLVEANEGEDWRASYQTVGQFMSTDLFTVRPEDLTDLAASLMQWRHIRHVPVEDDAGKLVGLVSHRALLRLLTRGGNQNGNGPVSVREIMTAQPLTVTAQTPTLEAIALMRSCKVGCLPVVDNGYLVGILTAHDFLTASAQLFEEHLSTASVVAEKRAALDESLQQTSSDPRFVGVPQPEGDAEGSRSGLQSVLNSA
jgi:CBS domain-containing protein